MLELSPSREWRRVYRFVEPWRFRLKIAPNLITQVPRKDFVLEKRLNEIDYYLERNFLEMKLQKLKYGYARYRYSDIQERIEYRNPLKNQALAQILDMAAFESLDEEIFIPSE
ncbi:MAG: hypothetical protein ACO1OF_17485 [Adhaeribacter sp.]